MKPIVSSLSIVTLLASVASAQPGQQPPQPYPPPQPQPYAPPPYAYQPVQPLTLEEQQMLAQGEISDGAHFVGAGLSLFLGFGTGQAAQGRWGDTGWIFTLGEVGAFALLLYGVANETDDALDSSESDDECNGCESYIVIGALAFVGLRLWEVVDAIAGPSGHNARVRELRMRAGYPPPMYSLKPYIAPTHAGDGGVAGVGFRF